jgi:hypothetical protein
VSIRPATPSGPAPTAITVHDVSDKPLIVVLTVCGSWDPALHHRSATILRECLAARPAGLIIDLTALDDVDAQSLPVWAYARHVGADIVPPVPVALCIAARGALADPLQQQTTPPLLPVYATIRQAHVALVNKSQFADPRDARHPIAGLRARLAPRVIGSLQSPSTRTTPE